jgi:hypothetical protein
MSQDGSNEDNKPAWRDRAIIAAVIGAVAVIGAALITGFLSRGGDNGANPTPSLATSSAVVTTPSQRAASPQNTPVPVASCNPAPSGLGAQLIYCDDFRSNANDWEDPNSPNSGDGVYRQGAYLLTAVAGGDTQVGAP